LWIKFERFLPKCILKPVSKLAKVFALLALALYGLASMHCILEGVPGFDFLKTCCFVATGASSPKDCESDECVVENADYRAEEQAVSAPQPLLLLALLSFVIEAPLPESQVASLAASGSPPELARFWQFAYRTALPPRAPSIAS
jgi:hypothetical protein